MVVERIPAAKRLGKFVPSVTGTRGCLSWMENLPSFCVVDVRGDFVVRDGSKMAFNPEYP